MTAPQDVKNALPSGKSLPHASQVTIGILVLCRTLCPFYPFLGGKTSDRIEVFPEALVRVDDHVIVHIHVRFGIDDDQLSTGTCGYIESFERTGLYPVSIGCFFRLNPETVLQFDNDPCIKVFCQASFDGILLHNTFLCSGYMLI